MRSFFLVLPVDTISIGAAYEILPLHCTVMPWFTTNEPIDRLLTLIGRAARRSGPIILEHAGPALFGPKDDIPVELVKLNPNLSALHTNLCAELRAICARFRSPEWIDRGYRPHITRIDDRRMQANIEIWAHGLYCFQRMDNDRLLRNKAIAAFAFT